MHTSKHLEMYAKTRMGMFETMRVKLEKLHKLTKLGNIKNYEKKE